MELGRPTKSTAVSAEIDGKQRLMEDDWMELAEPLR